MVSEKEKENLTVLRQMDVLGDELGDELGLECVDRGKPRNTPLIFFQFPVLRLCSKASSHNLINGCIVVKVNLFQISARISQLVTRVHLRLIRQNHV